MSQFRIAIRKIPPSVTEDEFKKLKQVAKILAENRGSLQFYSAAMVGDTSAPASAFAIITLFNVAEVGMVCSELETLTFPQPYDPSGSKTFHPVIERAPIASLSVDVQVQEKTKVADIEDDPDFAAFVKDYENGFVPETNAYVTEDQLHSEQPYDAAKIEELFRRGGFQRQEGQHKDRKNRGGRRNGGH